MIPVELEASTLDLPNADHCRIVVITSGELRHDRFALRLQAEFPGLVVAWLRVVPVSRRTTPSRKSRFDSLRTLKTRLGRLRDVLDPGAKILLSRIGWRV